jgi:hypothetical protein
MKLDLIIERYVQLRDRKAELKAAFDASVAEINAGLERLEGAILDTLTAQGVESVRTGAGTAYKSISTSVTAADGELFMQWCLANDRLDMLEKRPSKTAVEAYKAANDDLPPGINWKSAVSVGVRRA